MSIPDPYKQSTLNLYDKLDNSKKVCMLNIIILKG